MVFPQHHSFWLPRNHPFTIVVSLRALKSSATEWIVRMSLLSGTTDLLRTCYFLQWLHASLWNVCFLCHILWFFFNQGRNDFEGLAFLEFGLKGLGCMKTYFKPGETLWQVWESGIPDSVAARGFDAESTEGSEHDLSAAPEKLPGTWAVCSNTLQCSHTVDQRNGRTLRFLKWVNNIMMIYNKCKYYGYSIH